MDTELEDDINTFPLLAVKVALPFTAFTVRAPLVALICTPVKPLSDADSEEEISTFPLVALRMAGPLAAFIRSVPLFAAVTVAPLPPLIATIPLTALSTTLLVADTTDTPS